MEKEGKQVTFVLAVVYAVLLVLAYFSLRVNSYVALVFIILALIVAASVGYIGFKSGLKYYKNKREKGKFRYAGLVYALGNYMFLMFVIALLFSFLFIVFAPVEGNSLISTITGEEVHLGVFKTVHFNIITLTTLGYGNIVPQGLIFESIASIEVLLGIGINMIFVAIAISEIMSRRD